MKTPIQELIEFIDDKFILSNSPQISSISIIKLKNYLKEKKMMTIGKSKN